LLRALLDVVEHGPKGRLTLSVTPCSRAMLKTSGESAAARSSRWRASPRRLDRKAAAR